MTFAVFL